MKTWPHMLFWSLNMVILLLFANAEINSRITSTCPFYFWAVAELLSSKPKLSVIGFIILGHNIIYMFVNLCFFPMEKGFW